MTLLVLVGLGLLGFLGAGIGTFFALKPVPEAPVAVNAPPLEIAPERPPDSPERMPPKVTPPTPEQVVPRVKRSTVYIRASQGTVGLGMGSGFFAGQPGYIVTNAHVVGYGPWEARPATRIEVVLSGGEDGERSLPARIHGVDADKDLALLRVEAPELPPPLMFAKSSELVETQEALIFGYPYGELLGKNISVNRTTISSLRKEGNRLAVVQVAGGMHPGNSGGPVTNNRGDVIGVSVARLRGTDAIAFAIPPDIADAFAQEQIRSGGKIDAGQLRVVGPEPVDPITKPSVTQTQEKWKPLRFPPVKTVAITLATLKGERVEVKLPSAATNVCVGGSGRFLIFMLPTEKQLAVFNTSEAKIVKTIPVASPKVLFAAGAESLVVVDPDSRIVERWSLTTFEKEASGIVQPQPMVPPIAIAMGSASNGPLLVQALDRTIHGERFLFDVTQMKELPATRTTHSLVGVHPGNRLYASPDGRTFTVAAETEGKSTFLAISDTGVKEHRCHFQSLTQPPLPSGDGETILGPGEMADRTGVKVGEAIDPKIKTVWYLPAVHGPLHLNLTEQPKSATNPRATILASVHAARDATPLFTLPRLESLEQHLVGPPWEWRFDASVFFCPAAGYIAVLSRERDKLILERMDFDAALAKAERDYLFVNARPPSVIPGKRFEYALDVRSKKGGVKFKLGRSPNGMAVTPAGVVTWDVPAGFRESVTASVVVTDAGGRELTHTFELVPTTTTP